MLKGTSITILFTLLLFSYFTFASENTNCNSDECRKKLKQLKQYAYNGSPAAQVILGLAYLYGDGVEKKTKKAVMLIKKAAKQKSPLATMLLSDLYLTGTGVDQDSVKAKILLRRAVSIGHAPAMFKFAIVDSIGQRNSYMKISVCGGLLNETYIYSTRKRVCLRLMEARNRV